MKKKNHLFAILLAFASVSARADEVYNFYFQKPAETAKPKMQAEPEKPVEVKTIQPEVAPDVQKENPQGTSRLELPALTPKENTFHHWEISFGRSSFGQVPEELKGGTGYSWEGYKRIAGSEWDLGTQYNFSHQLSCDLHVLALQNQSLFDFHNLDFAVGLSYMPVHIDLIGRSFLSLGVIAGAMSVPIQNGYTFNDYPAPTPYATNYDNETPVFHPTTVSHDFVPYYGAKVSVYVGKDVSIVGSAKMVSGLDEAQLTGGVSFGL